MAANDARFGIDILLAALPLQASIQKRMWMMERLEEVVSGGKTVLVYIPIPTCSSKGGKVQNNVSILDEFLNKGKSPWSSVGQALSCINHEEPGRPSKACSMSTNCPKTAMYFSVVIISHKKNGPLKHLGDTAAQMVTFEARSCLLWDTSAPTVYSTSWRKHFYTKFETSVTYFHGFQNNHTTFFILDLF
ncbi:hypothetical protein AVEN_99575-1 [Araneus ventricosus]|uniref:Uncharacterized protein n=1 Tax=Araneus ventricosus TaxID=182803 RepID=A0A4Y2ICN5_ARAVE|nr:hypothetical protein AVEN_99575-1 [Araneus ventricosus]